MRKLLFLLFLIFTNTLYSQYVKNVRFEQFGDAVRIYYDLLGTQTNEKYIIKAYVSEDGGNTFPYELISTSGDIGPGITGGFNKKIIWYVLSDLPELNSDKIVFEVRAILEQVIPDELKNSELFTDPRDQRKYSVFTIYDQLWMGENLKYQTPYACCYNNNTRLGLDYGLLYTWEEAMEACPDSWRLPTNKEIWGIIRDAKLAGFRLTEDKFYDLKSAGYYWTSTEYEKQKDKSYYMFKSNRSMVYINKIGKCYKALKLSVRCIME